MIFCHLLGARHEAEKCWKTSSRLFRPLPSFASEKLDSKPRLCGMMPWICQSRLFLGFCWSMRSITVCVCGWDVISVPACNHVPPHRWTLRIIVTWLLHIVWPYSSESIGAFPPWASAAIKHPCFALASSRAAKEETQTRTASLLRKPHTGSMMSMKTLDRLRLQPHHLPHLRSWDSWETPNSPWRSSSNPICARFWHILPTVFHYVSLTFTMFRKSIGKFWNVKAVKATGHLWRLCWAPFGATSSASRVVRLPMAFHRAQAWWVDGLGWLHLTHTYINIYIYSIR